MNPRVSLKHHIYTYSGKLCSIEDPPSIEDVIVSLGRIARFSGNTTYDFNVMAHSIHVAYILWVTGNDHLILQGMVHDATECMFGDIPTPFKNEATRYLEKYAASNMFKSYGYDFTVFEPVVYTADKISLVMEARELLKGEAWKTILSSVELPSWQVDNINPKFLRQLIQKCDKEKSKFRPPNGILYTKILALIAKLKELPKHQGEAFQDFLYECFDPGLKRDAEKVGSL